MTDARRTARTLEAELKKAGSSERAAGTKKYLKSDLRFYGVALGDIRSVAATYLRQEEPDHDGLTALIAELWDGSVFERRMFSVVLMEARPTIFGAADLPFIEDLLRRSATWALVDGLAVNVVGDINLRKPIKTKLDRWAKDQDFWIRRSSLLAELRPLKAGVSLTTFAARADAMLEEREFFIRKAIGWVLREAAKKRPDEIYKWLAPRTDRVSGVTIREAVRWLPPKQAEGLMSAYKEKRPLSR